MNVAYTGPTKGLMANGTILGRHHQIKANHSVMTIYFSSGRCLPAPFNCLTVSLKDIKLLGWDQTHQSQPHRHASLLNNYYHLTNAKSSPPATTIVFYYLIQKYAKARRDLWMEGARDSVDCVAAAVEEEPGIYSRQSDAQGRLFLLQFRILLLLLSMNERWRDELKRRKSPR